MAKENTNEVIGRSSATERDPNTSDKFNFWITTDRIVNPFDIVEAKHLRESKTFGLVTTLEHRTDANSHLANFISNNFGSLTEEPNTPRMGATLAKVNVMMNSDDIYMPIENEKDVCFADETGIHAALGIDTMEIERRIPAGLIKMSNEEEAVVYVDRNYVLGPESAHLNISGISGLATKTSYAMFLLQSLLQTVQPEDIAVIIMNVKHGDLLQIDEPPKELSEEQKGLWIKLGLEAKPFGNVHYFLPRAKNGQANSYILPRNHDIFAYALEDSINKLDLLFSNIPDPSETIDSLVGEIQNGFGTAQFKGVSNWNDLLNTEPLAKNGLSQKLGDVRASSVGKFRRHLRRIVQTRTTGMFTDQRTRMEQNLSERLREIEGGHTYVVDIAKLNDTEQSFVFGDIVRTIYEMFAESDVTFNLPEKVIIFVDELNKYAPSGGKDSALIEQILDISERGRSLGVILFSAQQFMSAVHSRVTGNCATKILGRSTSSEVNMPDYRFLDQDLKISLTRLAKGELLLQHAVFRQPVKVIFPKPAYMQND
ncbi:ATP-binding protein [candidate division KSB1 bacterium]|nr:ATP-binding protein [candidate division KSB1 bacterium]MBL7093129.1 ATP-binding protein [candidate division KSB1 bacterium]